MVKGLNLHGYKTGMRVGVNVRLLLNENMEGIPRYIYETTQQMALSHPEDEFILFFDRKVNVDFGFPLNVKAVIVPWHARHAVLWHFWFEYMLPLFFRWYKIDVFYSGDGYLSLRSKVPAVLVMHDLAYLHYPEHIQSASLRHYRKYVPRYLSKAASVIAVSHFVKNDIITQMGIDKEKIKVAYNAVRDNISLGVLDEMPWRINEKIAGKPYFLYIGALQPRKNIARLIKAFELFSSGKEGQYKLVIAGRLAWKTEEIAEAIMHSPDVIYTGMVSEPIKYKLISGAMAVTYISLFEGFGIPLLEAMKMGTPVITSSVTSMPEVAGEAALLIDPTSVEDIAQAMSKMADNEDLRNALASKGLERYKFFSWEKSAEIIYDELKGLML